MAAIILSDIIGGKSGERGGANGERRAGNGERRTASAERRVKWAAHGAFMES
jgi:hypothetical protein